MTVRYRRLLSMLATSSLAVALCMTTSCAPLLWTIGLPFVIVGETLKIVFKLIWITVSLIPWAVKRAPLLLFFVERPTDRELILVDNTLYAQGLQLDKEFMKVSWEESADQELTCYLIRPRTHGERAALPYAEWLNTMPTSRLVFSEEPLSLVSREELRTLWREMRARGQRLALLRYV